MLTKNTVNVKIPVKPVKTKINNSDEWGRRNPSSVPVKTRFVKISISP